MEVDGAGFNEDSLGREGLTTPDAKVSISSILGPSAKKKMDHKLKGGTIMNDFQIPRYQMDYPNSPERGFAVIINNENFHWSTGMNERKGTDADCKHLTRLFNKLDFNVKSHKDVTKEQIMQISAACSKSDHSKYDCFIMVFLSHGDDGVIYGTDGTLKIKNIVELFDGKSCPTLSGKPKIFVFQACRGNKHEEPVTALGGDVVDAPAAGDGEVVVDAGVQPTIPNASDFLFCYSVTEGFYSHRDTLYGSWYIQALVEVFEKALVNRGHDTAVQHDILDLLTLVQYKVSRRSVERTRNPHALGKKQMPCFLSMLTKKLYLAPKKSPQC